MKKKTHSWVMIALMLYLFFPVGIYMLVKKITGEKLNYVKNGKALRILAWIFIAFAVLYLIMAITGQLETEDGSNVVGPVIMMLILFGGGGVFSLYKASDYIKKGTKYNRYMSIINASNKVLIDNIAAAYPTTYEKAVEDIQAMINDGYFMNAYVDYSRRELIIPICNNGSNSNTVQSINSSVEDVNRQQCVKCENCGATNIVTSGTLNKCEYCGFPL